MKALSSIVAVDPSILGRVSYYFSKPVFDKEVFKRTWWVWVVEQRGDT
jgi:hypothetical protein